MSDIAYYLAQECLCSDGSGRPCKSDVGHFVNHQFVPNANYYKALKEAQEWERNRPASDDRSSG
jgi:hypothetical protein